MSTSESTQPLCHQAQELALMTLEHEEILETDQLFLNRHLLECASCRAYQRTMVNLIRSVQDLDQVPLPTGLTDKIMARVAAEADASASSAQVMPGRFGWKKAAPIAAAVLFIALAVPLVMNQLQPQSNQLAYQANPLPSDRMLGPDGTPMMHHPEPAEAHNGQMAMNGQPHELPNVHGAVNPNHPHYANQGSHHGSAGQSLAYGGGGRNSQSDNGYARQPDIDSLQIASASPDPMSEMNAAVFSDSEEDVYYDPVSTLVGF